MSGLFNEIERLCGGSTPQMLNAYFGTGKSMNMETKLRLVATDKGIEGFAEIAQQALAADYGQAKGAIADAQRVMKRIIARSTPLPEGSEEFEIKPTKGPTLEFRGNLLSEHTWTTRGADPMEVTFEVYQTLAGALVAISSVQPADREGFETIDALVVDPGEDIQAMRFAVMDFFEWSQAARTMARKDLKWDLRRDVA